MTLLLSVATESQSNKSPLREISCTIQVRKKLPLSRLRQILLARRFQINCKLPVYEERDPDYHERLEKLWWCLWSNRKQDSMWSWVVCFSAAICNALNLGFVLSFGVLFPLLLGYRKIPKISPGAYIFQRPFLRGLFLKGLIFGGAYLRREILASKSIGLVL